MGVSVEKIVDDWGGVEVKVLLGDVKSDTDFHDFSDAARNFFAEKLDGNPLFDIFDEFHVNEDDFNMGKEVLVFYEFNSLDGVDSLVEILKSTASGFQYHESVA